MSFWSRLFGRGAACGAPSQIEEVRQQRQKLRHYVDMNTIETSNANRVVLNKIENEHRQAVVLSDLLDFMARDTVK